MGRIPMICFIVYSLWIYFGPIGLYKTPDFSHILFLGIVVWCIYEVSIPSHPSQQKKWKKRFKSIGHYEDYRKAKKEYEKQYW